MLLGGRSDLSQILYPVLWLAFVRLHPGHGFRLFPGARFRRVLISFLVHSLHQFHVSQETNPEPCGWRDICPGPAQRLAYGQTTKQTYATKHVCFSSFNRSRKVGNHTRVDMAGEFAGSSGRLGACGCPGHDRDITYLQDTGHCKPARMKRVADYSTPAGDATASFLSNM
jgi:hypothetical protein